MNAMQMLFSPVCCHCTSLRLALPAIDKAAMFAACRFASGSHGTAMPRWAATQWTSSLPRTSLRHQRPSMWARLSLLAPMIVPRARRQLRGIHIGSVPRTRRSARGVATRRPMSSRPKTMSSEEYARLPPLSQDGGDEEAFREYWKWFNDPQCWGSWVERRTHPQISVRPFWYNVDTDETVFDAPHQEGTSSMVRKESLQLDGVIEELSVKELRATMQDPEQLQHLGLTDELLARRALWEYETFIPRVLSWHDFQYNTFWFFISDRDRGSNSQEKRDGKRGFFTAESEQNKKMFAHDGFFNAVAELASQRLDCMHPINLVYLLWTFTRAGVPARDFFSQAADHFCNGRLPTLDRCGLGTLVWCYSKQRHRHPRLFDRAAKELQRNVRVRSLAPRNFQNTMIAYRWYGKGHEPLMEKLAEWMPRLLDDHDERRPKLRPEVMFSYTCKDGSVVPADSFRINGLNIIARGFVNLDVCTPKVEACLESITDYVIRSAKRSPAWMRTEGDLCAFTTVIAEAVVKGWTCAPKLLNQLEAQPALVRRGANQRELSQLESMLERAQMSLAG
ncbi:unnamed protein product [Effrenium voratum]|nr:unnamed protein product [Effrenium voratum]